MTYKAQKPLTLYVCGITPYDHAHIGHGRCYVTFDLFVRLNRAQGIPVTYCRNFTDIDDKLLHRAAEELGDEQRYPEIATRYMRSFNDDVQALNCIEPTYAPRVTDHIAEIIAFVDALIQKGHAYEVAGDVYFSIDSYPRYGSLSGREVGDLRAGARVHISEKKRNPLDFALWKSEPAGTFWQSPWGSGRPGWHIECSALAHKYLGHPIDVHGGGMDLIFPHHENEQAQSEACFGAPFVKRWMHNAFVRINQEKMSKSLGNFFTLTDIFKEFPPALIRFYYLNHHYRNPLDFSHDDIRALSKAYKKLVALAALSGTASRDISAHTETVSSPSRDYAEPAERYRLNKLGLIATEAVAHLENDLNSPGFFGVIFEHLTTLQQDAQARAEIMWLLREVMGMTLEPLPETTAHITPEIQKLIDQRTAARAAKNWVRADELREQLKMLGFEVQDKKG